jgi:hypothetical protein
MFVPCIAGLCIENQHCALGFVNVFIIIRLLHVSAPACHPQGASLSSWVMWKLMQLCMASGNVNLCALCASLWCCTVQHHKPAHRAHKFTLPEAVHSCISFHITHTDRDAPWGWHVGAETCRSCIIINTLTKPSAQCWFSMHNFELTFSNNNLSYGELEHEYFFTLCNQIKN